jgi:hypothetical protein
MPARADRASPKIRAQSFGCSTAWLLEAGFRGGVIRRCDNSHVELCRRPVIISLGKCRIKNTNAD